MTACHVNINNKGKVPAAADEAALMTASVSARALGIPVPDAMKNALRARMMKSMLMTVAARNRK